MKKLLCLIAILLPFISVAQPLKTRSGEYTYVVPSNQSLDEARKIALDKAKLKIIEDEFGTAVGVNELSKTTNIDGVSSSMFLSVGELEVKGEWIATVGEPTVTTIFSGENLAINVKLTGKIREITSSQVDLEIRILQNGIASKNESDTFRDKDDIFILFKTPVKGYVAVYHYDSDGVFRLLPYYGQDGSGVPVKGGVEYLFFEKHSTGVALSSEVSKINKPESNYKVDCKNSLDLCRYYIVFSPNEFSIANDVKDPETNIPATVEIGSFQKWMIKAKKQDPDMVVAIRDLTLKNK